MELGLNRYEWDEVVRFMAPRIDWLAKDKLGYLKGYDLDDVKQELLIELWKKWERVPHDKLDFRFSRYMETVFKRQLINLRRAQSLSQKDEQNRYVPRDMLDHSLPLLEDFDPSLE